LTEKIGDRAIKNATNSSKKCQINSILGAGDIIMEHTTYNAVRVIISIIPIVGIVMGSVVVFFYLLWNHKRRINNSCQKDGILGGRRHYNGAYYIQCR